MYTGWDRYKKDTNDKGQKYELIRENNEEYIRRVKEYFIKENEESFKELKDLQENCTQERNQKKKMEEFIKSSWKSWMESQREGSQNQKKENQGSQKEGQQETPRLSYNERTCISKNSTT
jgi:hypothetical protein